MDALVRQAAGELKQVRLSDAAGVLADVRVDRQSRRLVADERIVLPAEITSKSDVRTRFHEGDVGRHRRMVRPAPTRHHRADRGIEMAVAIDAGSRLGVAGLEDTIRLVIAVRRIDGTNDREAVEHGGLFRQMLAQQHAGQARAGDSKGTTILRGPVGLGIPGVDVAGAARHPQEDDALARGRWPARLRSLRAVPQQGRHAQARQASQARLEQIATAEQHEALWLAWPERTESVLMAVPFATIRAHDVFPPSRRNGRCARARS